MKKSLRYSALLCATQILLTQVVAKVFFIAFNSILLWDRSYLNKMGLIKKTSFLSILIASTFTLNSFAQYAKTVAKDGSGDYLTVQAAIDAAPTGQTTLYRIFIKNGTYKETVTVPSNKPFIQLVGESVAYTIITFDNFSGKPFPGGGTYGTGNSATVTINATDFSAVNITFENTTGESPQALAINVNNDRASFKNCRFLGGQDTLLVNNNGLRQYYLNCYIDGTVDFIFGNARAVFDYCVIYPKDRSTAGGSFITAANTKTPELYGFVFRNCQITANTGVTSYVLGRPWQNDAATTTNRSENKTVFINTTMGASISAAGWATWDAGTQTNLIIYAEFESKNPDGSPLNVSSRVSWSKQFTSTEAAEYSNANLFASWDPTGMFLDGATYAAPLIVSNFRGIKGSSNTPFKWNLSWPIAGVQYEIFRSDNNGLSFTSINTQTAANNNVNFNYTASNPAPGTSYQYYVVASKAGYTSYQSSIITITSVPTITVTGNLSSFLQGGSTPSSSQTYTVSGVDLTNNIVLTPPTGYEISSNGGTNWYNLNNPINLAPTNGTVSNTTIYVRLNANSAAIYNGDIFHVSIGATSVNQAVTGTAQTAPLSTSSPLIIWPLITNTTATNVATGVNNSNAPTLNGFTLSNGTYTNTVPAYSTDHGMSFGVSANGGNWSSSATPPGPGNLSRNFYTEFSVQPNSNYQLRVDTITFNTSLIITSGNFAVSYSTNNFVTTTDINTGIAPNGTSIAFTSNGAFTNTAIAMIREDFTNLSKFKFPVNNLMISNGSILKIRVYFRTGSGSEGRYVKIKDFTIKGEAVNTLPLDLLSFKASILKGLNPKVNLVWKTTNEVNTSKFDIERSLDGKSFFNIGIVNSKNTPGIHDYVFVDDTPFSGTAYYRLNQIDLNGSNKYSPIEAVNNLSDISLIVYPNPVSNTLNIAHPKANKGALINVISINGQKLMTFNVQQDFTKTSADISKLTVGTYLIMFDNGSEQSFLKFIKY